MSVYTEVSEADLISFLTVYPVGRLCSFTGIHAGIENTNYFVNTDQGEFVLTLFEHMPEADIRFSLAFTAHLAEQSLPCARPQRDQQGDYLRHLHGKPASLVTRLNGQSLSHAGPVHCHAIGQTLARLHLAGLTFTQAHDNRRGSAWRARMQQQLLGRLDTGQQALLRDEMRFQQQDYTQLPRGIIHSDLFRDNVLFSGDTLSGLLDLYDAGQDLLLYDLAITATDWCVQDNGEFDAALLQALVRAYHAQRPVSPEEQQAWPGLLRRAALRFWLSRLYSLHYPRAGHLTQQKDPQVYQQMLESFRQNPPDWPA